MADQQPEALRIAEALETYDGRGATTAQAAAELRRLHAELEGVKALHIEQAETLIAQRDALRAQVERLQAASETWHSRYLAVCQDRADEAARLGAEVVGLEGQLTELQAERQVVGYRVSIPAEPDLGFWFDEEFNNFDPGMLYEPVVLATPAPSPTPAQEAADTGADEREAFEVWARQQVWFQKHHLYRRDMTGSTRFGQYIQSDMELAWQSFRAALAAQLPAEPAVLVPLSDDRINELALQEQFLLVCDDIEALTEIVRAVELAHGINGLTVGGIQASGRAE